MLHRCFYKLCFVYIFSYFALVYFCDKYIFETTLIFDSWIRAYVNYKNNPQFYKMFNFVDTSTLLHESSQQINVPLILFWFPPFGYMNIDPNSCPGCVITYDQTAIKKASAVIFHCIETRDNPFWLPLKDRTNNQRWVWLCMEPPWNTRYTFQKTLTPLNGVFNWTMTYRLDSDFLSSYAIRYSVTNKTVSEIIEDKSAPALGAWISSNCHAKHRIKFVEELSRYISIDRFGECGNKPLCRGLCEKETLYGYKFFLALENSFCKDYISEKFWIKAISYHVVPVVMGPSRHDYELVAPPHSFIHVDDFDSVKSLAEYLIKLDQDDELYAKYLQWMVNDQPKLSTNVGLSSNTPNGMCDLCEKLKREPVALKGETVEKLDEWWYGKGYSPKSEEFSICSKSTRSGKHRRWKVTLIYSLIIVFLTVGFYSYFGKRR